MSINDELDQLAADTQTWLGAETVAVKVRALGTVNPATGAPTVNSKVLTVTAIKGAEKVLGSFGGGGGGAGDSVGMSLGCEFVVNAADLAAATATSVTGTPPSRTLPEHDDQVTDEAGQVWDVVSAKPEVGRRQVKLWTTRARSGS